jgi:hypothetical protein
MALRDELLLEIEAFLERSGMGPGTFGSLTMADGKLVPRLRAGADLRTQSVDRIREFIRAHDAKFGRTADLPPSLPSRIQLQE